MVQFKIELLIDQEKFYNYFREKSARKKVQAPKNCIQLENIFIQMIPVPIFMVLSPYAYQNQIQEVCIQCRILSY